MAQVARPLVPEGPITAYYEHLHALHLAAGQPSMRQIQRGTRSQQHPNGINPTTIHDAFSAPRLARWEVVQAIVRQLDGDVNEIALLWRAARDAEINVRSVGAAGAAAAAATAAAAAARSAAPVDALPLVAPAGNAPAGNAPAGNAPVPRQLPPDVYAFTGRDASLAVMDELLGTARAQPTAVVISALSGTAGVGKTALAVHWAHRVADQFPDGHLYVDLRGYGPDRPVTPDQALAGFLRSLGLPSVDIPGDLAEATARYRSLMAGRRVLVVLDNVRSVDQVRPLLPGSPTCLALVTSRDSLAGLIARDGARRIDLDLLARDEAVALLRTLIGARTAAEPAALDKLAELCARLPLALRIAAELAAARPVATLAELVAELSDEQRRLELLDAGADERTGIRSVFSWSYRGLAPHAARLFRLCGLSLGPDLDSYAAAALAGRDLPDVQASLDALLRSHLIQHVARGCYAMHDLLRTYAGRLAEQDETEEDRSAALARLFDYYLATAARAMDTVFPAERHRRPLVDASTAATPSLDQLGPARAWLDSHRDALVSAVTYAAHRGPPTHAIALAAVIWRYLQNGAHHQEAITVHTAAIDAAASLGDRTGEGVARTNLGTVYWRLGRYSDAAASYEQALPAFRALGDRAGETRVLVNLGAVYWQWGRYDDAANSCQCAFVAFREVGDGSGEARALDNLGAVRLRQGHRVEAAEYHKRALTICRELGDVASEARALDNLGAVRQRQGRYAEAAACHRRALTILRDIGDRAGEAQALENLGNLHRNRAEYEQAFGLYAEVLELAARIGSRSREASTRNAIGETFRAAGRPQQAEVHHESALLIAQHTGELYEQARARNGLAHARHGAGDRAGARRHWQDALTLYTGIGVPEADDVDSCLAALDPTGSAARSEAGPVSAAAS